MNRWVEAARPRTLPLAVSSILLGNFLAFAQGTFHWAIAILAVLTTLSLQILSNFANDLGDFTNGIDTADRKVALRAVQTGKITQSEMLNAVKLSAVISFILGITLVYTSLKNAPIQIWIGFIALGLSCIAAAIAYTVGKRPYGYIGLGDLSVFLFFGLTGTVGTYFLHTQVWATDILLPASGCGFLSVSVLNLNNLRDLENDKKSGKNSIPVRIGKAWGFLYQKSLLSFGILCFVIYTAFFQTPTALAIENAIVIFSGLLILIMVRELHENMTPAEIDPYLRKTALRTLLFICIFGLTQIFYHH
jgi:1,4-dihydroxy-2-naphthoate octaprenyltransferase